MKLDILIKLIAWLVCCMTCSVYADATVIRITNIQNPPLYAGVLIGDVLSRTITVEAPVTIDLMDQALPLKGSQRNGIELRELKIDMQQQGNTKYYVLHFDYQVFASRGVPVQMQLPAEQISFKQANKRFSVTLPAWRFWFSAQVPDRLLQARQSVIPQYRPALLELRQAQQVLVGSICVFLIGLFGLIYHYADAAWLPWTNGIFARTYRQLKKLPVNALGQRQAVLLLQSAFNVALQQQMLIQHLPVFLARYPGFHRMEAEILHFFEQANALLYAGQIIDISPSMQRIKAFSRHLRDCERRR